MSNHYHLVLRPLVDGEMSRFMGWVGGTHTMRYHAHYHTGSMIFSRSTKMLPTDITHVLERLEARGPVNRELGDRLHQAGCQGRAPPSVAYYAGRIRDHYRKLWARELFYRQLNRNESGADVGDDSPRQRVLYRCSTLWLA